MTSSRLLLDVPVLARRAAAVCALALAFTGISARADAQTNYRYLAPVADFATTSGTWVAVTGCSLTFTPGSTSEDWVVIATGQVRSSSTAEPQAAHVRMRVQGTVEGEAGVQNNPANAETGVFLMHRITGTTASQTIDVQAQDPFANASTTTVEQCSITAFLVPSDSDFQWTEVDGASGNCVDTPDTTILTHQFTPSSAGDYLFLVSFVSYENPGGSTNAAWVDYPVAAADAPDFNLEDAWSNARDLRQSYVSMRKETLGASLQTLRVMCDGSAVGGSTIQWAKVASFRMDAFAAGYHDEDVTELTATSATWTNHSTVTQAAPPVSSEFIMLGTISGCRNSAVAGPQHGMRFREDGVVQGDSVWGVDRDCSYAQGVHNSFQWVEPYTTASAKTWDDQYQSTDGVTQARFAESAIHVLRFRAPFRFRKSITVDRAKVPGSCGATLANFPMLYSVTDLDLRTTANGGDVIDPQGDDIIFRALDDATCGGAGTAPCTLDHEIESYNATTGQLVAWVRIPSLNTASASANTVIYIYYGNPDITTSTQNADGVWDANYVGVWHLKEEAAGTGTVGLYIDSSGNGNHGDDLISATGQTGRINGGHDFDGVDDRVNALSGASLDNLGPLTFSCWVRPDTFGSANSTQVIAKSTIAADAGYLRLELDNTAPEAAAFAFLKDHATTDLDVNSANSTITLGSWQHLTATWDGSVSFSGVHLYRNGGETAYGARTNGAGAPVSDATLNMMIGANGNGTSASDGLIDEVRISNIVRSSCWIGAEYNNMNAPGDIGAPDFYTVGSEVSSPLTAVELIAFRATAFDRAVLVEWRTGYEIDNLGFHVYREVDGQRTRVTRSLVAGSGLMAGQGAAVTAEQRYAYWDLGAVDRSAVYWLEDVDFSGTSTWHGPVTPVDGGLQATPDIAPSETLDDLSNPAKRRGTLLLASDAPVGGRDTDGSPPTAGTQWTLAARAAIRIGVNRPGWYRVTQPQLLAAGLDPDVDPRLLQIFIEGVEQAMTVTGQADGRFDAADAIEFYGTGADTPFTNTRVYWLAAGSRPGRRIPVRGRRGADEQATTSGSFSSMVQQKERSIYFAALRNGDEENWFGALVSEEPAGITLNVSNVDASGAAALEVSLQGVTETPNIDPDHQVGVLVNGTDVGELRFDGRAKGVQSFPIPAGVLVEGANSVTMIARGAEPDYSLVDVVRLRYAHTYHADADMLRFPAEGPATVTVTGFASSAIRVLDITDPLATEELRAVVRQDAGLWRATVYVPTSGPRRLLAFTKATVAAPAFVRANRPSRWHAAANAADYLVISHADFADWVAPLVARRAEQGLSAARVDVEDVYDEFSFGEKTPQALQDFVRHARATWRRAPRFLLLVGDATIDPRDYAGFGDADFVPTKQVPMAQVSLETSSDDWFADDNDDGLPELAVGRLSVRTGAQAEQMVAKILDYEDAAASWTANVTLVADRDDEASDFERSTRRLRDLVPSGFAVREVYSGAAGAAAARAELLDAVNQGQLLVNYTGHGSVRVWGREADLLTSEDVTDAWRNRGRLPLVVAMNCLNGFFHGIYDEESLAETLLRAPDGGAVAVWASSGVTESSMQARVNQEFFRLIFTQPGLTVGEAVAAAKRAVADRDVRRSWILFGDPALRLHRLAQPVQIENTAVQSSAAPTGVSGSSADAAGEESSASALERAAEPVRLADFNADGRDDLLFYEAETGRWSLVLNERGGRRVTQGAWLARAQLFPARLDGDRFVDLFLYAPASGEWMQALGNGDGTFRTASGVWTAGWEVRLANFIGDARAEVLVYHSSTGDWCLSDSKRGFTFRSCGALAGGDLSVADFNRDALADLFISDRAGSGWVAINDGSAGFSIDAAQWPGNWPARATNLAGRSAVDLVLYDAITGTRAERLARAGRSAFRSGAWSPELEVAPVDVSGDDVDDVLLYNPRTGSWSIWTNTSSGLLASGDGVWPPGLTIATGDLDGDHRADVLLYDRRDRTWTRCTTRKPGTFACDALGALDPTWTVVGYQR